MFLCTGLSFPLLKSTTTSAGYFPKFWVTKLRCFGTIHALSKFLNSRLLQLEQCSCGKWWYHFLTLLKHRMDLFMISKYSKISLLMQLSWLRWGRKSGLLSPSMGRWLLFPKNSDWKSWDRKSWRKKWRRREILKANRTLAILSKSSMWRMWECAQLKMIGYRRFCRKFGRPRNKNSFKKLKMMILAKEVLMGKMTKMTYLLRK